MDFWVKCRFWVGEWSGMVSFVPKWIKIRFPTIPPPKIDIFTQKILIFLHFWLYMSQNNPILSLQGGHSRKSNYSKFYVVSKSKVSKIIPLVDMNNLGVEKITLGEPKLDIYKREKYAYLCNQ